MITHDKMPQGYIPLNSLTICSNTLLGGGNLVAIGNNLPLVIGKGEKPKIWLQALANSKENKFVVIVEESISKHPLVKIYEEFGTLNVELAGETILAVKITGKNSAEVEKLDFRPIGLNMHGNKSSLTVGGNTFSGNSMSGGGTLIGLGSQNPINTTKPDHESTGGANTANFGTKR
jgi:hypothetical protein